MQRKNIALLLLLGLPALNLCVQGCGGQARLQESHFKGIAQSADGVPIHYETDGAGEPALVFVHGWSCDRGYWDKQVAPFSGSHRVVRIDLGGHGESGLEREDWTIAAFGADVNAVLDELKLDDVVLIGHSMGGGVIAEAAIASPKRVRGLVGVDNFQNPALGLSDAEISGYLAWFESDFKTNVTGWVRGMFPAGADSALADQIATDMADAPPAVALSAMKNLLHWYNGSAEAALAALPAPLLAINSDGQPTDEAAIKALRPDYELRLISGTGHFVAQEDPAGFNTLLGECLASLSAKRP